MLLAEVVGRIWPRHQVEPGESQGRPPKRESTAARSVPHDRPAVPAADPRTAAGARRNCVLTPSRAYGSIAVRKRREVVSWRSEGLQAGVSGSTARAGPRLGEQRRVEHG